MIAISSSGSAEPADRGAGAGVRDRPGAQLEAHDVGLGDDVEDARALGGGDAGVDAVAEEQAVQRLGDARPGCRGRPSATGRAGSTRCRSCDRRRARRPSPTWSAQPGRCVANTWRACSARGMRNVATGIIRSVFTFGSGNTHDPALHARRHHATRQERARVGDHAGDRRRGDGGRAGEVDLRRRVAHAPLEVAGARRDAHLARAPARPCARRSRRRTSSSSRRRRPRRASRRSPA